MTRLEEIYQRTFSHLPECMDADRRLEEKVKEAVETMDCLEEEREGLSDAMFTGCSIGQEHGFYTGFRFAMGLIFEGLVG